MTVKENRVTVAKRFDQTISENIYHLHNHCHRVTQFHRSTDNLLYFTVLQYFCLLTDNILIPNHLENKVTRILGLGT